MADLNVLNAVWATLMTDSTFLSYLGLTPTSTALQKGLRCQKEQEPPTTVDVTKGGLVLMYPQPGITDPANWMVYKGKFAIDFYASSLASSAVVNGITLYGAMQMGARAKELLNAQRLPVTGTAAFDCYHAYETAFRTGISGVKGFRQWYDIDLVR